MTRITATPCPQNERLDFLPSKLPSNFMTYEHRVFGLMAKSCEEYSGGFWEFYSLSNEGFFMAPVMPQESLRMQWRDNYFDAKMSVIAAGISVNLMAQSHMSYLGDPKLFGEHYHRLRDYAYEHEEAALILTFID